MKRGHFLLAFALSSFFAARSHAQSLVEKNQALFGKNYATISACDREAADIRLQILKAIDQYTESSVGKKLDSLQGQLEKKASGPFDPTQRSFAYVGNTKIISINPLRDRRKGLRDPEMSTVGNWNAIWKEFSKIGKEPSALEWEWLIGAAQNLLMLEEGRILATSNFYGLDQISLFESSKSKLEKCFEEFGKESCQVQGFLKQLNQEEIKLFGEVPFYRSLLALNKLNLLHKHLSMQAKSREFKKNPSIYSGNKNGNKSPTLFVPMNFSKVPELQFFLSEIIEKAWSQPKGLQVRVVPSTAPDAIVWRINRDELNESYVESDLSEVVLSRDVYVDTVIHEFGHVLGFRDNYAYRWDELTCSYERQSHSNDLMSNASTGMIQDFHWKELKKRYISESK